jgi:hypothetical protein
LVITVVGHHSSANCASVNFVVVEVMVVAEASPAATKNDEMTLNNRWVTLLLAFVIVASPHIEPQNQRGANSTHPD